MTNQEESEGYTEMLAEAVEESMPICIGIMTAKKYDPDANIMWSQWDFDGRDDVWKLDAINDLIGLLERKAEEIKENNNEQPK